MTHFMIQASIASLPHVPRRRRRPRGFTLVELLLTIMIAAILAAVAAPSFKGAIRSVAVRGAASELVAGIQFARSEAIRRNNLITFTFDTDRHWQIFFDKYQDCLYSTPDDELLRENTHAEHIQPQTASWWLKLQPSGLTEIAAPPGASFPTGICLQTDDNPRVQRFVQITRIGSPLILENCP